MKGSSKERPRWKSSKQGQQGVYCRSDRKPKRGIRGVAGGDRIVGRQLMKVRMRAIAVILAIAMSAWVSFEAHAGGQGGGGAQSAASTISGKIYQFEKIAD